MLTASLAGAAQGATLPQAEALARDGRADDAAAALHALLASEPNNDQAQSLLCTIEATMQHYDEAVRACEAATRIEPASSQYQLKLARTYGAKADHAGAFTGMRLVSSIRGAFERAVQLDGKSVEALSDLGEFYVDAPSIVGGGLDKAKPLADRLMALNAARGHRLLGMIAAKEGDLALAEAEYRKELAIAHSPEAYVDLANFWMGRKQWSQAAEAALGAIQADTEHGPDTVDAARQLLRMNRNLDAAQGGLRAYLANPSKTAETPAFAVHTYLGQVLQKQGDIAGAKAEFQAALALAHDYAPARKGAAA